MRILLLSDYFPPGSPGGASRIAAVQAEALARLGHEVTVLTTHSGETPPTYDVPGVRVHNLDVPDPGRWRAYLSLYNPRVAPRVAAVLDELKPEVVHAHNVHTTLGYHGLRQASRSGARVILTAHDTMTVTYGKFTPRTPDDLHPRPLDELRRVRVGYFPLRNSIIRRVIRRNVDAVVTPTEALKRFLQANGIKAAQMVTIHNGIDTSAFHVDAAARERFVEERGLRGRKIVVFAGRVSREKGADQLMAALARTVEQVPEALLLILARREGGEKVLKLAETIGVGNSITFAGWLDGEDLAAAYAVARACVVPSIYYDNLPTVALEAQAAGTPVIASTFGGVAEAIREGETGFAVNPHDVEAFTRALVPLLRDDNLRQWMGQCAREHAAQHFDWMQQAERLTQLYQRR